MTPSNDVEYPELIVVTLDSPLRGEDLMIEQYGMASPAANAMLKHM